jgi:RNA recognition motif-containing protein
LHWDCSELDLGRNFEKYGDIKTVKIMFDRRERSMGYGFVEFEQNGF